MLIIFALLLLHGARAEQGWTDSFNKFINNQSESVKEFFLEQRNRVAETINSSYHDAIKMQNEVNTFFDDQLKQISSDVNNYVDTIQKEGQKVFDSLSYLPIDRVKSHENLPDEELSVPDIITRNGYTCETHYVMSQGYILGIHRIPRSKSGGRVSSKSVLLQHGVIDSSADWILNGPGKGLAYVLADAGYDVWMSNTRGNKYSKGHAWLRHDTKPYWNFSWHEVAEHDLPAVIDYIIKIKGDDTKLTYIGHSMGTTILFTMLTLRPEYNKILHAGLALAPVVFMTDFRSPINRLSPIASNVAYMEMLYGSHEFVPKLSALGRVSEACHLDSIDAGLCKNALFFVCGFNDKQFNSTLLTPFIKNIGTGTSWKTIVHFAQQIVSGKFQRFDYGKNHNRRVYGSDTPPEYDLSKVTLHIKLFWALNDLMSSEKDVQLLYSRLPSDTDMYLVPDENFNHLDYLWAIDAPTLLNDEILRTLSSLHYTGPNFGFSLFPNYSVV